MRTLTGIDEVEAAVGTELGTSEWLTVDQDMITAFADATDDHQWIHLDEERAAAGPFGATIAHGFYTLSLLPKFSAEIFAIEGVSMKINYGLNKVRFPQPVLVDSRLRDTATLTEVTRSPKGTQLIIRHVIEIEGQERPACIAEMVSLLVE
ncbi:MULTISPECIES: MaoC family dehydratase [Brevibacterium]|uniref:MaoC family dehydratase n=1 Tax=Brevibacterium casei TaxID=33889 RepID=A0A7T4A091_9MICO|nr:MULTISPECIES: MaoC family dehydratase [Brevibacterium]MCM1010988.1 MaoC family dehydratase [Brevibacterium sp. XM4083]QQB14940.1 MaoC family dehydratase [Brevibacterium casei]